VALYLSVIDERAAAELQSQFTLTDAAIENIWALPRRPGAKSEGLFRFLQDLNRQRHHIVARFTKLPDAIERYTQGLILPAIALVTELMIHDNRNSPARMSALAALLQWQEQVALEREAGAYRISSEWLGNADNAAHLKDIINEQQTYERLFFGLMDENQKQTFATLRTENVWGNAADDINTTIVTGRSLQALDAVTARDWFTIFDAQTTLLHDAARMLTGQLADEDTEHPVLIGIGQILDTDVETHLDLIKTCPLFKGIGVGILREILHAARLVHYDKNSLFLIQGEQATRFFIILDGLVKIFKSTAEGNESIMQILGKKEALLDADVLSANSACGISAKAVTKIKLLAIPAPVMRDALRQYKELALNMLAATTRHAQRLVTQFEQMTLRSATERVGWFLLNLHLETVWDGQPINLPFDKALIASWLNIKPETFSRILQTFRTAGFRINRQQIALPEPYALCDFCDSETALKCQHAGTDRCPRSDVRNVVKD